jgi:hypothetical protein
MYPSKRDVIIDQVPNTTGYAHSDNKTLHLSSTDIFFDGCLISIFDIFSKPEKTRSIRDNCMNHPAKRAWWLNGS